MPTSQQPSTPPSPRRPFLNKLLLAIAGFSFVGFADSAYLTADHYFALPLPCTILHGCDVVLHSAYSMVGPIPLAVFGVVFYLVVLFTALYLYTSDALSGRILLALYALAVSGFVMSVIFELIQALIIHALCQYCALQALCATAIFITAIWLYRSITRVPGGVS